MAKASELLGGNLLLDTAKKKSKTKKSTEKTSKKNDTQNKAAKTTLLNSYIPKKAEQKPKSTNPALANLSAGIVNPLDIARRDAATGVTPSDKVKMAVQSKAVSEDFKKTAAESKARNQERTNQVKRQKLSTFDQKLLTPGSEMLVQAAKLKWNEGREQGDREKMAEAHREAEAVRKRYGYSGGSAGDRYIREAGQKVHRGLFDETGHGTTRWTGTKEEALRESKDFLGRLDAGLKAATAGAYGSILSLGETAVQATNNRVLETNRDEIDRLANDLGMWEARLKLVQQGEGLPEWGSESYIKNRIKIAENAQAMRTAGTMVDPNLPGQSALRMARDWQAEATRGMSGAGKFLADTAISGAQMLPGIAASFIPGAGPAIGAGLMSAQAAGQKAYELTERGIPAGEAVTRGVTSGLIEGATERLGLGTLVDIVTKAGGASFLKNVAKQAGIEASEESASYILNLAADRAAKDPEAQFSLAELAQSAAAGALLGGAFGGVGSVASGALNRSNQPTASAQSALLQASNIMPYGTAKNAPESALEQSPEQTTEETKNASTEAVRTQGSGATRGEVNQRLITVIQENHEVLSEAGILANLKGDEFSSGGKRLSEQVADFFASIGNKVTRLGFGDVALTKRGAKDSIMPGVGRNKAIAFSAVPAVIEDGTIIDEQTDWKGRGYDSVTFGGKIQINGIDYDMGVVVKKYDNQNTKGRYYLHEVVLTNEEGETVPIKTGTLPGDPSDTFSPSELSVAPEASAVNNELPEGQGAMSRGGAGDFATWQGETPGSQFHPINEQGADMAAELYGRAPVELPTTDPMGRLTSKTVSTLANAGITNNQLVQSLEEDAVNGGYSYISYKDEKAKADAEEIIRELGYQKAKEQWIADAKAGKLSKENTALGLTLINNAANSGTLEGHIEAHDLIGYYISYARTAGQALQAMNMVNKMTPTGQLYNFVKTTEDLALNIKERTGKDVDFTIDPELSRRFMEAVSQEERNAIKVELYKDVASQIPNTFWDKANAWRYLAMLGNPRTHIRNIAGNLFFDPVRTTKNVIATGLEGLTGAQNRTKAVTTVFSAQDRARYRAAQADFTKVENAVMSGGKYNDDWSQIDEYRRIFKNPLLESARKGNAGALEAEDRFFSKRAYADSLSGWLKANGFTGEEYLSESFDPAEKERARQYAIKEAQKATYRDLNAASELVLSAGQLRNSQNKAKRAAGFFVEGVLPFKKTPTNILVRGLEYSPAGLTKGIVDAAIKVRRGDMDAAEAIDEIAAGLTGTGLLSLGAGLAAVGLVSGGASGDDKQDEFNELQGHQNYALEVGDTSYTIDWLAPEALPFFVGVELYKFISGLESGETEKKDWTKAVTRIAEPMLEMSMLQSLNDVINSFDPDVALASTLASSAMSYLGQFFPTLGGQIERTFFEDTRQSTYVDRDSAVPTSVQYMLGTIGNKIPGWDYNQADYVDAWGRTESTGGLAQRALTNFFSPGYSSQITRNATDAELQRLYDAGYENVFPTAFDKKLEITTNEESKEKRTLSGQEWTQAQTTRGQTAGDILAEAIQSDVYQNMTDAEKAKFVASVYDYAKAVSRLEAGEDPEHNDAWVQDTRNYVAQTGGKEADFFVVRNKKNQIDADDTKPDGEKAFEFESWVDAQPNYTDDQKKYLKNELRIWGFHAADSSKYHRGAEKGYTIEQMRQAAEIGGRADKEFGNANGSMSQGELYQAIKSLGLDDKESAILYDQAKPKNWKATWYTSKRK